MYRFKKNLCASTDHNEPLQLQKIIKPIYIVTSLLGLFPYSVTFIKKQHSFVIVPKSIYVNSLCGVTICLIIFLFLTLHIKEVILASENTNLTEALLTQINYIFELVALIIFCIVAYVCAFLNRIKYVKTLNQIISTWYYLLQLLPHNDGKIIFAYLRFRIYVVCMGSLFLVMIIQVIVNFTRENSLWKIVCVNFTFNLPQMIQFVTLGFFYMLVTMVVALLMNIEWHCRRLIDENKPNSENLIRVQRSSTLTLRKMELVYVKAYELKTNINDAFQGPILAMTLQCFHSMVSESHIIYHGLVVQKSITTHEILNCSLWIMYQILKIYSIAFSGNLLKVQALKIGQILHNIPTEKKDTRWLMEVQHFSTLMYYQDIEITVYDYFPLNATLLYNMLASATMYLIILVQFDK